VAADVTLEPGWAGRFGRASAPWGRLDTCCTEIKKAGSLIGTGL